MPTSISEKLQMADVLSKSGLMPQSLNTPQKVFIALQMGHELNVPPMVAVNNIAAVNGRPVISADLQVAVARQHPEFGGMDVENDAQRCTVRVRRVSKSGTETFQATFSMDDAQRAGLLSKDNWKKYPARMLKHRATAFALRDAFPDALAGFYTGDEIQPSSPQEVYADTGDAEVTVTSTEQPGRAGDTDNAESEAAERVGHSGIEAVRAEVIESAKRKRATGAITETTAPQWWREIKLAGGESELRGIQKRIDALKDPAQQQEPDDRADLDAEADAGWDAEGDGQQMIPDF
jgi:hypothetical protein